MKLGPFELNRTHVVDCLEGMGALPSDSIDSIVTDPPYGLEFMGRDWDRGVPGVPVWQAALRVAKPGAFLMAFGGTRTYHRLTCAIEDAGWEIRDCLLWLHGEGFPKNLAIDKAIDRATVRDRESGDLVFGRDRAAVYRVTAFIAAARDRKGIGNREIDAAFGFNGMASHWTSSKKQPAVPSWEHWLRLKGLLEIGDEMDAEVWRLNGRKGKPGEAFDEREEIGEAGYSAPVDHMAAMRCERGRGERIPVKVTAAATEMSKRFEGWGTQLKPGWEPIVVAMKPIVGSFAENAIRYGLAGLWIDGCLSPDGRWPSNVVLDPEVAALLDAQTIQANGASRFFYVAKPKTEEREAGLLGRIPCFVCSSLNSTVHRDGDQYAACLRNPHPTVKPVALMEWLCRLTRTPDGGIVFDPFIGSGTTGVGALDANRPFLGFDSDSANGAIANARTEAKRAAGRQLGLFEGG